MTNPIASVTFSPGPRPKQPLTVQGRSLLTIFPSQSCRAVYTSEHAYFILCANRIIQHMASVTPARRPEVLLHSLGEDRLSWSSLLKSAHPLWKSLSLPQQRCCDRGFRWNTAWRDSAKLPKELRCPSPNQATEVFLHAQCFLWCRVVNIIIHLVLRYCSRGR